VQDVRWDADTHNLLFNMACPSYASGVNGKGSKLHCYNPERRQMVWSTDWLTSNDIFILDSQYVFCSYGFTSEKKFLFMLDKLTGKVLSKLPFTYKIEYLELQTEQNGREYLYVIDYNDHLYKYQVQGAKTVADNGKVFTVCYAVSDDGFLNVRSQPSMNGEIIGKLWMEDHGLGRGILIEKGKTWSKVRVGNVVGWVYTKYLGQTCWMAGAGPKIVAAKEATPIYCENNATGELDVFTNVDKGTIIADIFFEHDFGNGVKYYELRTGHDYLFIKKSDVIVKY
jgi:outer membrane protein assembly factor BamB